VHRALRARGVSPQVQLARRGGRLRVRRAQHVQHAPLRQTLQRVALVELKPRTPTTPRVCVLAKGPNSGIGLVELEEELGSQGRGRGAAHVVQ
jgi:hypothetical protein